MGLPRQHHGHLDPYQAYARPAEPTGCHLEYNGACHEFQFESVAQRGLFKLRFPARPSPQLGDASPVQGHRYNQGPVWRRVCHLVLQRQDAVRARVRLEGLLLGSRRDCRHLQQPQWASQCEKQDDYI